MKLFAFCFLFAAVAAAECPIGMTSVPLKTVDGNLTIPVSINGQPNRNFILDTGAAITVVSPSLSTEFHLLPASTPIDAIGAKGALSGYSTNIDSVAVAGSTRKGYLVAIMALKNFDVGGRKVQGILGEDFLSNFDILIQHGKTVCIK